MMNRAASLFVLLRSSLLYGGLCHSAEHPDARNTPISTRIYYPDPGTSALNIGRASLLRHLDLHLESQLQSAYRPLGVIDNDGRWMRSLVEHQQMLLVGTAVGLFGRTQLSLQTVALLHQSGNLPGRGLDGLQTSGLGDLRVTTKTRVWSAQNMDVAIELPVILPTATDDAWLREAGAVFSPSLLITRSTGPSKVTFRLGYEFRKDIDILGIEQADRLLAGFVAEYSPAVVHGLTLATGLSNYLQYPSFGTSSAVSSEWVGGFYYDVTRSLRLGLATTAGLTESASLPAFQGIFEIKYLHPFGNHPPDCSRPNSYLHDPRCEAPDTDRDGIKDPADTCPSEPEDQDGYKDDDGCPDPDNDNDEILDVDDKCPIDAEDKDGFEDEDGCPDLDNDQDGIGDADDKCPDEAENINQLDDGDGCPEPDQDNDGVLDDKDKCPTEPEDRDDFEDEDGCPDPDNDQDKILDVDDICPDQPENYNNVKDEDGCPDKVLAIKSKGEIRITEEIHFDHGQVIPTRKSRKVLRAVLRIIERNPGLYVRIEGHTDNLGGEDFNRYLSQARAQAIRDYLVRKSKKSSQINARLSAEGVGKTSPKSTNKNKKGRASNRRVRFIIEKTAD
ncbi:MAG: OmpA family protein [Myxococcota bacterium]|nr:OmpA family protein [Myxococcota bacterium]